MVQEPSFDSRVQHSSERDMFGLYKTLLDWRFSKLDRLTLDETIKYCAEVFTRETLGLLKVDSPVIENFPEIPIDLRGDEHHSGTTRMGADDTDGAVDKNLKVFGTNNLFIAGSSILPTNSWANPTFAIIALALGLTEHIQGVLNESR